MVWERLGSASVSGSTANTSWKEIARTTLGSAGDTITVDSIPARDNLMIIPYVYDEGSNQVYGQGRFNNDSGSNYANRWSRNGGSDTTNNSQSEMITYFAGAAYGEFGIFEMANIAGQEKLLIDHGVAADATGAGTAPKRHEGVHKWANTSNQVTRFDYINGGAGTFDTGSEVVVLGYNNDEADSGTNFWQELASVDLSSGADEISTGTIASKKYIMWNYHVLSSGAANGLDNISFRFNNDTGNNYCYRHNDNGGSDAEIWDPVRDYQSMSANVRSFMKVWECPKPVVAEISGWAIGGATDLLLCADLLFMADDAQIGYAPSRIYGTPTTMMRIHRIGLEQAKQFLLTGRPIDAETAFRIGLVSHICEAKDLSRAAEEEARRFASIPSNQLALNKLLINQTFESMGCLLYTSDAADE